MTADFPISIIVNNGYNRLSARLPKENPLYTISKVMQTRAGEYQKNCKVQFTGCIFPVPVVG